MKYWITSWMAFICRNVYNNQPQMWQSLGDWTEGRIQFWVAFFFFQCRHWTYFVNDQTINRVDIYCKSHIQSTTWNMTINAIFNSTKNMANNAIFNCVRLHNNQPQMWQSLHGLDCCQWRRMQFYLYSFSMDVRATRFFQCYDIFASAEISSICKKLECSRLDTITDHSWQSLGG